MRLGLALLLSAALLPAENWPQWRGPSSFGVSTETGLPVVTCVQAQVHACLSRAGYDQPIEGYGRLLRQLGQAVPA